MTTPINKELRNFILDGFNNSELSLFCFDYFEDAEQYFSDSMPLLDKALELIKYCKRQGRMADLLRALEQERPLTYPQALASLLEPDTGVISESEPQSINPHLEPTPQVKSDQDNFIHEKTGLEFVRIPAGEFLYGPDTQPIHLPEYWISKNPVTFAAYQRFMGANSNHPVPYIKEGWAEPYNWDAHHRTCPAHKKDHPVVLVSWYDATAFCKWADLQLPTEEQWEKAARGTNGLIYPWGNMWQENHCNSGEVGIGGTTPVGQFSPHGDSPYGCVDMSGNVLEWCLNKYQTDEDINIDQSNDRRVLRGGSFNFSQNFGRATLRDNSDPGSHADYIGFRVVVGRSTSQNA
jgi:formylglycine-generating enzyme required for sulfatase activity